MNSSAAALFAYFEKVEEIIYNEETNELLGKPAITFDQWLEMNK